MEAERESAVAEEQQPGFAEPGLPGEAEPGCHDEEQYARRRRRAFSAREKQVLLESLEESGQMPEDFSQTRDVSAASLRKWRAAYAQGGIEALEPKWNQRNPKGRTRGHYSPEERFAAVDAFERSGMGQHDFARAWGVAVKSLTEWIGRYRAQGRKGLEAQPRPKKRPGEKGTLPLSVREAVLQSQAAHPGFGLRKLRDFLARFRAVRVSPGSVRKVLTEAGVQPQPRAQRQRKKPMPPRRFERSRPGELWQSDITSFLLARFSQRVYLTVFLDDYSRYVVAWRLALQQKASLVSEALLEGISRFGKPKEVLTDQGRQYYAWRGRSSFERLLSREGIEHVVSRAHHPETLGKCERLWETINREFWERVRPGDIDEARERLGHWFAHYNHFRTHQGIDGLVPADRFFGAERSVRAALEAAMNERELELAVGKQERQSIYSVLQLGEHSVSVHGERGKVVIQLADGTVKEIGLEELGMPQASGKEQGDGHDRSGRGDERRAERGAAAAAADAALPQAGALQAAAAPGLAGEGPVAERERRGEGACAQDVHADAGVLAGAQVEVGDGGGLGAAAPAGVAAEPAGLERYAGGPAQATQGAQGGGDGDVERRARGAAAGECAAPEGERTAQAADGALEALAIERGQALRSPEERRDGGEKKDAPNASGSASGSAAKRVSGEDSFEESWIEWLERSA